MVISACRAFSASSLSVELALVVAGGTGIVAGAAAVCSGFVAAGATG